jgi:hypothetical protein
MAAIMKIPEKIDDGMHGDLPVTGLKRGTVKIAEREGCGKRQMPLNDS